ncbi:zinc finger matrin-type protein 5-like [Saccoglossus kowalevskii]|uniref:Zinc finger matrin-type protein 5-like n=1 Tax=Saccoglossus kowalevskii TaxID=10224 RepID=A0ABM0GRP9_SACKO|nr:PREDICTED: zinc finger matrin-type protein 5-like [Saccoglossus kowalevskii]
MGKRYYCDYCDKSFADNPQNRKKHMKGVQHMKVVKDHYDQFKDPAIKLREESAKKPCRKFQMNGHCSFGSLCIYGHLTPEVKEALEREVEQLEQRKLLKKVDDDDEDNEPSLEDWLKKRSKRKKNENSTEDESPHSEADESTVTLPLELQGIANLPPSLLPPPPGGYEVNELAEWGW